MFRVLRVVIILLMLAFVLVSFQSAHAVVPVNPPALESYYFYNSGDRLGPINGIMNPDGSLVTDGSSYTDGVSNIFLTKFDVNGKELWKKTYTAQSFSAIGYLIATSDGGYAATGTKNEAIPGTNSTEFNDDTLLIKTDSNGNLLWERTYHFYGSNPDNGNGHIVQQTADGGFILISQDYNTGAWRMIKTDASGVMEWNNTLPDALRPDEIVEVDDGYLILYRDGLSRMDLAGNLQWKRSYDLSRLHYIIKSSDSGYVILGNKGNDIALVNLDTNYNLVRSKTYYNGRGQSGMFFSRTSDDGYIITGFDRYGDISSNIDSNILLLKIDSSGNQQWYGTYSQEQNLIGSGYQVIETSNGGYDIYGMGTITDHPTIETAWNPVRLRLGPLTYPGTIAFNATDYRAGANSNTIISTSS